MTDEVKIGSIGWIDLTVDDAEGVRDFYKAVTGWQHSDLAMDGGYSDFVMELESDETPTTGICHQRGQNAGLPKQWIIYIVVADLDASLARCAELGGKTIREPRSMGKARYALIEDPAGAVCALYQA